MDDICGGKGSLLNLTSVWHSDNPSLPQCFSRSVLTLIPGLVILTDLLRTSLRLASQCNGTFPQIKVGNETSYTIILRTVLLWMLLSLKIAIIVVDVHTEEEDPSPADLVYFTVSVLVILANMMVQVLHYRLRVFSSPLQLLYWVCHVLCYLPTCKLSVERLSENSYLTLSSLSVSYFVLREASRDNTYILNGLIPYHPNSKEYILYTIFY